PGQKGESQGASRPDRRHNRPDAEDIQYTCQIVSEHMQRHLGGNLGQRLHQEVRGTHPHLDRAEGMLVVDHPISEIVAAECNTIPEIVSSKRIDNATVSTVCAWRQEQLWRPGFVGALYVMAISHCDSKRFATPNPYDLTHERTIWVRQIISTSHIV